MKQTNQLNRLKSISINKIMISIAIVALISSIGIASNQNGTNLSENLTYETNITTDYIISADLSTNITEANLPNQAENKERLIKRTRNAENFTRNLENKTIPTNATPATIPSYVSYTNPVTGISVFATYFYTGAIYTENYVEWTSFDFYLPTASYVYSDISGWIYYLRNYNYYDVYIDSDFLNRKWSLGSCNDGVNCDVPLQISRTTYLAKGWHTLYLSGYGGVYSPNYYAAQGYISIMALPEYMAIKVKSPNGGESWAKGTTKTIYWTKYGNPGANVKIELYKSGVRSAVISSKTPNDGSYSWYIPSYQPIGTDYKIKITSYEDSKYYDWSDNNFRIY
jgi:hypothetical protein